MYPGMQARSSGATLPHVFDWTHAKKIRVLEVQLEADVVVAVVAVVAAVAGQSSSVEPCRCRT
jgi:hypothetical protein